LLLVDSDVGEGALHILKECRHCDRRLYIDGMRVILRGGCILSYDSGVMLSFVYEISIKGQIGGKFGAGPCRSSATADGGVREGKG
jgi:hypothetical protein